MTRITRILGSAPSLPAAGGSPALVKRSSPSRTFSEPRPDCYNNRIARGGDDHELTNYQNITYSYINDRHLASVTGNGNIYQLNYDALARCVVAC